MNIFLRNRAPWLIAISLSASCAAQTTDFTTQVQPILTTSCAPCHHGAKGSGGLALDSAQAIVQGGRSGPVIKPGDPSNSPLYQRIASSGQSRSNAARRYRSARGNRRDHRALDRAWRTGPALACRASGKEATAKHWAYIAPVRPAIPAVHNQPWVRNPIDAFILSRLERKGCSRRPKPPVKPSSAA